MKKILTIIVIMLGASYAVAKSDTKSKIQGVGTPACITVSTSAWVAIPSTTTIKSGRGGIFLSNNSRNSGAFNITMTSHTLTAPSVSTGTFIMQIAKGEYEYIDASQFVYTFAVSTHTSEENICYQEITLELDR